ncbi:hypothetical protein EOW77_0033680 [Bradyrhizobium yuanmingense]|uniref:hypothetical protein n=1 Tax=Bradyrhizobium yuanmingense TaxID=108015 RepID=UPI000FE36957|nr:hypothetical protein [Bradyrhizobium yuanmingense]TGN74445.1 hypothetical protein EOW77_0033680 [Bradyrhizobium yuanmingense]
MSGRVAAFLADQYGPDFAAAAINGSLIGTAAQACSSLGQARKAGWPAVLGGAAAYAVASCRLQPLAHWGFFLVALVTLPAAVTLIPHCTAIRSAVPAS